MSHDIIIIGAGPAGLSFARDVAGTGPGIVLIERQPENVLADPPYDGREIALTHASQRLMQALGMWDLIPEEGRSLIRTAKVMNGTSPYALSFTHTEAGEDNLGFMVSNNMIRKAAYESLAGFENVKILSETSVKDVSTDAKGGRVELESGEVLEAKLIVAADSRFSRARQMMGISTDMLDFGRTCIVCKMEAELPHEDTAYECFHFDRTLAILPLNKNEVSIVITLKTEEADEVLRMSAEDFAADIERRVEGRFGEMKLVSELHPYPLVSTLAARFYGQRFALIGDAAVGMHPVTAHGFNLGLRGAHILSEEIRGAIGTGLDYASQTVLERYGRKHRLGVLPLYHGTNTLVRLYSKTSPAAKFVRRALLRLGNRIGPAKRMIMDQLTEVRETG